MESIRIGVIGGTSVYSMPDRTDVEERIIDTPYGQPSDAVVIGTLAGERVAFIPRHGRGHVFTPSEVPYRANIYALKLLGVQQVISVSACGSLREDFAPGHIVIPDQLVDRTRGDRPGSFFEEGLVAHVSVADPFCGTERDPGRCRGRGRGWCTAAGRLSRSKGRASARARRAPCRSWGMDIIGMTASPEAYLAREAEIVTRRWRM